MQQLAFDFADLLRRTRTAGAQIPHFPPVPRPSGIGLVATYVQDALAKAGRAELFDAAFEWDRHFTAHAHAVLRPSRRGMDADDVQDRLVSALLATAKPATLARWASLDDRPPAEQMRCYLRKSFHKQLCRELEQFIRTRGREVALDDHDCYPARDATDLGVTFAAEEAAASPGDLDTRRVAYAAVDGDIEAIELLDAFLAHVARERNAAALTSLIPFLLRQVPSGQIARETGTCKASVSLRYRRIKRVFKAFAEQSGNAELVRLFAAVLPRPRPRSA